MLLGGEVAEESVVLDEGAGLLIRNDIVDPRDVIPAGPPIPVDAGPESGRMLVGVAGRDILPA